MTSSTFLLSALAACVRANTFLPRGVPQASDWLVSTAAPTPTTLTQPTPGTLLLSNGLLSRTFATSPCFATIDVALARPPQTFFRGLSPEALITLNGDAFPVGGCVGQTNFEWFDPEAVALEVDPRALVFANYSTSAPAAPFPLSPGAWDAPQNLTWPPAGLHLEVNFLPPATSPSANGTNFTEFARVEFPCPPAGCLTGWHTCDNSSVAGQCSWPAAAAVARCSEWPACAGVTCNGGRSDCQARAAPFVLQAQPGFTTWVRTGAPAGTADTLVTVHYEMYDGLPLLRKWVSVAQRSGAQSAVTVDALTTDLLRAPNFAPNAMTVQVVQPANPTPFDQQTKPELPSVAGANGGRTEQLWFFDPLYDQCCDQELHVQYSACRAAGGGALHFLAALTPTPPLYRHPPTHPPTPFSVLHAAASGLQQ